MTRYEREQTYRRWWVGKYLRDGRKIVDLEFIGVPSGMTGSVMLEFDDGAKETAPMNAYQFRPVKKYMEVFDLKDFEVVEEEDTGKCEACGVKIKDLLTPWVMLGDLKRKQGRVCSIPCSLAWLKRNHLCQK